jgi:hypothetical protein
VAVAHPEPGYETSVFGTFTRAAAPRGLRLEESGDQL